MSQWQRWWWVRTLRWLSPSLQFICDFRRYLLSWPGTRRQRTCPVLWRNICLLWIMAGTTNTVRRNGPHRRQLDCIFRPAVAVDWTHVVLNFRVITFTGCGRAIVVQCLSSTHFIWTRSFIAPVVHCKLGSRNTARNREGMIRCRQTHSSRSLAKWCSRNDRHCWPWYMQYTFYTMRD